MNSGSVNSYFFGTMRNSFAEAGPLPEPVFYFFIIVAIGFVYGIFRYLDTRHNLLLSLKVKLGVATSPTHEKDVQKKIRAEKILQARIKQRIAIKLDNEKKIPQWLIQNKIPVDIMAKRNDQKTLVAVGELKSCNKLQFKFAFKDIASKNLLLNGSKVYCMMPEVEVKGKKINAFSGNIASLSEDRTTVIKRTTAYGHIARRTFSRNKIVDQRYIKVKIWTVDSAKQDFASIISSVKPDISIDNRKNFKNTPNVPQVIDISKGGVALIGNIQNSNIISRNDLVALALLIYVPSKRKFQTHFIFAEVRTSQNSGHGLVRLSFQFLRRLELPMGQENRLFTGQQLLLKQFAKETGD